MNLYKIMSLGFSLLLASSLTAAVDCGDTLQTLNVAISQPNAPFEFIDANGNLTGFDIDVICAVGRLLGFAKIQFKNVVPFSFSTFVAGLNNGTFTVAISAISMTPANLGQAAAVKYNDDNQGFLYDQATFNALPQDEKDALSLPSTALDQLNLISATVGVPVGSFEESILNSVNAEGQRVYDQITVVSFNDTPSAVAALRQGVGEGAILAYFANAAVVTDAVTRFGTTAQPLLATGVGTTADPVVIDPVAVAAGASTLGLGIFMNATCCQLYVNILAAIAQLERNGVLPALRKKWNTGTFTPLTAAQQTALTPTACANTMPNLPVRCAILEFAIAKFCPCNPTIVATIPAGSI